MVVLFQWLSGNMLKCVMLLFIAGIGGDLELDDSFERLLDNGRRQAGKKKEVNYFNETYFPILEQYQVNAKRVKEDIYPWIARVVHSRKADKPHVCTAVCLNEGVFATAARCIYRLVVSYTTVIFRKVRFPSVAFVVPTKTTKQLHDDIGFIVVDKSKLNQWPVIEPYGVSNRTDNIFKWLTNLMPKLKNIFVVGYAAKKGLHKIASTHPLYELTELAVTFGMDICPKTLSFHKQFNGFRVPCYHSCNVNEFLNKTKKCINYHGVEGGALLDKTSNKLIGVATWGAHFASLELPVGVSVPNSWNFFSDYACAQRISKVVHKNIKPGYYQSLCKG